MGDDGAQASAPIDYDLLKQLQGRAHPLLHIAEDFEAQIRSIPIAWTGEVFEQARSAHHLLDLAGIEQRGGYANDLDSRTYLALMKIQDLQQRVDRIQAWHRRESAAGGMVGDFCVECGHVWPCDTLRMVRGTYVEQ